MSTPRTDAEGRLAEWNGNEFLVVHVEFARSLELELTACKKALDWSEQRIEQLLEQNAQAMESLRIIAGERQGADNLMSDKDIARQALRRVKV